MNHSPAKCQICGEYHCLVGCVPIQDCYTKKQTALDAVLLPRHTEVGMRVEAVGNTRVNLYLKDILIGEFPAVFDVLREAADLKLNELEEAALGGISFGKER